jgi:hypothetical protein
MGGCDAGKDYAGWLDSLRTGAHIMFAAGDARMFFNNHRPLILNGPDEIDTALTQARSGARYQPSSVAAMGPWSYAARRRSHAERLAVETSDPLGAEREMPSYDQRPMVARQMRR